MNDLWFAGFVARDGSSRPELSEQTLRVLDDSSLVLALQDLARFGLVGSVHTVDTTQVSGSRFG